MSATLEQLAASIAGKAIDNLEAAGTELRDELRERAVDAGATLAMAQFQALVGQDVSEAQDVAQARFANLAAATSQATASAIVNQVRAVLIEGIGTLVQLAG